MARTKAYSLSNKSKGTAFASGMGYKGVLRRGSKYGWKYEDGKLSRQEGGFDTPEEAAYAYDEFLIAYVGPNADTNQALGFLKLKQVLEVRAKITKAEKHKPVTKRDSRKLKLGVCGFKGVSKHPGSKSSPFKAQVTVNGKYVSIGVFKTAEEAARAYDLFVLKHHGADAVTNSSLGLLPPIGAANKKPVPPRGKELTVDYVEPQEPDEIDEKQPEFIDNAPGIINFNPIGAPDPEREAQIIAARAMAETEDADDFQDGELPVEIPEAPEEPVFTPAPAINTEVLLMSDAEKLRVKAAQMLAEAAELEAGAIKASAAVKLDGLSKRVAQLSDTLVKMIDCCAEIETELSQLRDSLK